MGDVSLRFGLFSERHMKLEKLTSLQTQRLKLPVVFTECAGYEAVYLEQPASIGDLGSRLGDTLEDAYTCLFPPVSTRIKSKS